MKPDHRYYDVNGIRMQMPVFVLTCGKDPVMTPDLTDGMEQLAPHLTRHHIEDCSHWSTEEHPEEVGRALVAWLHGVAGSTSSMVRT